MITTIYLDMDDVLTDFTNTYHKVIGIHPRSITPEQWDENWSKWVHEEHFVTQPMLPGAAELLDFVEELGVKTEILTSTGGPNYYDEIAAQKHKWLQKHKIWYHVNIVPGKKYKSEYATPHRLLIDDQEGIVEKFRAAGGLAIHHTGDMTLTILTLQNYLLDHGFKRYE